MYEVYSLYIYYIYHTDEQVKGMRWAEHVECLGTEENHIQYFEKDLRERDRLAGPGEVGG
jgi:hypothetical protein